MMSLEAKAKGPLHHFVSDELLIWENQIEGSRISGYLYGINADG
jgi:hypothetical protein